MRLIYRPIGSDWPGPLRSHAARPVASFRSTFSKTLERLDLELVALYAHEAVVQIDSDESAMRLDGGLRANATVGHPGVILNFTSLKPLTPLSRTATRRDLRLWTDKFANWQDNLRAIALGLEAMRKLDRYGLGQGDEIYTGWIALDDPVLAAEKVLRDAAGAPDAGRVAGDRDKILDLFREAALKTHPDRGGTPDAFRSVIEARDTLLATCPVAGHA
jgi:hypothetical protein